ncbi:hypothetical protein F5J12DRAFT_811951 [Pisolithus orientalis]|uniref:uncharacterized protein n=1 Tax=Pisolithus orientalis TaxID=936130 RepID=UPI002225AD40|nr:uncharacterized protein F5J12DRAFT_811951 [Pisolithus orientalis]KAI6019600.1 hypothetical protein F5J12DRAFT_811951 [Pisolithus orientalis]
METIESLVQERVVQLRAVAQHRNELLRQMYYMMRQRHRAGSIMDELDQVEDDTDGLHEFMDRFDLDKKCVGSSVAARCAETRPFPVLNPAWCPISRKTIYSFLSCFHQIRNKTPVVMTMSMSILQCQNLQHHLVRGHSWKSTSLKSRWCL